MIDYCTLLHYLSLQNFYKFQQF